MTIREALTDATESLRPHIDEARLDANLLLEFSLKKSRAWLVAHDDEALDEPAQQSYQALLSRRINGEPLAYITGEKEFWSLNFKVTADVLIPRPDTELLVETALEKISPESRLLDLGTGSGAIACALAHERQDIDITATDVSEAALRIATENAATHCSGRIQLLHSDWFSALKNCQYDIIVSNPPYVENNDPHLPALSHEPRSALTAGSDGLDDIRQIIDQARNHLSGQGWLMLEHGSEQGDAVRELLVAAGYVSIETRQDLAGLDRVTIGTVP